MISSLSPFQSDELPRLNALARLQLDAVAQDPVLDALVRVAAQSLHCPIACINMVGSESVWSLATHQTERLFMPRADAFCSKAVAQRQWLEIPDLRADEAFARHAMVEGTPHLRFYAGAPVVVDGHCLGTVCVLDTTARQLSADEVLVLQELAQAVGHWLSHRHEHLDLMRRDAPERRQLEDLVAIRAGHLLASGPERAQGLPPRQRPSTLPRSGFAARVREDKHSMAVLIDDILDFAEWGAGPLRLQPSPLVLRPWIERLVDAHLDMAIARGVRLHTFVDPGLCEVVMADPLRLGQVLDKLLAHAIELCDGSGGPWQVSLRCLAVGTDRMCLQVGHVTMPGPEPQSSPVPQPGSSGLSAGLGLSIAQRLVKAMDGEIRLTRVPGQAAACTVELPVRLPATPQASPHRFNLKGVICTWHGHPDDRCVDWSVYLRDAGAIITRGEPGLPGAPASGDPELRLKVHGAIDSADIGGSEVRFVRGRRRSPQRDSDGELLLDEDALHRDALLHAVLMAADRGARNAPSSRATPSIHPGADPPSSVLVADADPVSRALLARQLALLGVSVVLADGGDEALRLWRTQRDRFSLVLVDVQLKGLDGPALCRAIRGGEAVGARIPVIALVDDMRHGDPERCLASGMDDCLAKPMSLDQFSQLLQHWQAIRTQALPRVRSHWSAVPRDPLLEDIDPRALERAVGPDRSAQADVCRVYLDTLRHLLPELHAAVALSDWNGAGEIAHRLKSSSKILGARLLGQLLDQLEQAGRNRSPEAVRALLLALPPAVQGVQEALADLA